MKKGFSLLELLVATTIIGLLIVGSLLGFSQQQKRSRDSRRLTDISSVAIAIESYASVNSGSYPYTNNEWCRFEGGGCTTNQLPEVVTSGLLTSLPVDPKAAGGGVIPAGTPNVCNRYAYQSFSNYYNSENRYWALAFGSEISGTTAVGVSGYTYHPLDSQFVVRTGMNLGCGRYLTLLLGPRRT